VSQSDTDEYQILNFRKFWLRIGHEYAKIFSDMYQELKNQYPFTPITLSFKRCGSRSIVVMPMAFGSTLTLSTFDSFTFTLFLPSLLRSRRALLLCHRWRMNKFSNFKIHRRILATPNYEYIYKKFSRP